MKVFIKDLAQHVGEEVVIFGWLYNKRSSSDSLSFLELRDGTGWAQAVAVKKDLSASVWAEIEKVGQESSVEVAGTVTKHPKKENVFELQLKDFKILQNAVDYPIALKDHGPDFLLDNRHLWLRSKKQWAILRVRDAIITAISDFL